MPEKFKIIKHYYNYLCMTFALCFAIQGHHLTLCCRFQLAFTQATTSYMLFTFSAAVPISKCFTGQLCPDLCSVVCHIYFVLYTTINDSADEQLLIVCRGENDGRKSQLYVGIGHSKPEYLLYAVAKQCCRLSSSDLFSPA